jgi:hypothetical protein
MNKDNYKLNFRIFDRKLILESLQSLQGEYLKMDVYDARELRKKHKKDVRGLLSFNGIGALMVESNITTNLTFTADEV